MNARTRLPLPLNQLAFSVIDLKRTEAWWREGLGFLPAGGTRLLFRGPLAGAVQGLPKAAMTCWCLLGRNEWSQIEMFEYEIPVSKLMPEDFAPNDIGYTRCGVWVEDFDAALARLATLDTLPLTSPIGAPGRRRVCVRNPDGVYVELMEEDPLPDHNRLGRQDCPVALRYATMSTPDMARSLAFLMDGFGMTEAGIDLHGEEHEALWGLAGAQCKRKVLGGSSLLLEVVEYDASKDRPWRAGYRLCDQGILNICFGDPSSRHGVDEMYRRALKAGARRNAPPIHVPFYAGLVYINDPLGFSYEFLWAAPGRGHRDFGFEVLPIGKRPQPDNVATHATWVVPVTAERAFELLTDDASLSQWSGLGRFASLAKPGITCGIGAERIVMASWGNVHLQIVDWQPGRRVLYRIIKGGPLMNHHGEITLTREGGGTRITWIVRFRSRIPGMGKLLRGVVKSKLVNALHGLQRHIDEPPSGARH